MGVPKGRRSNHEGNLKCAIREFEEETDLRSDEYTLLEKCLTFIRRICWFQWRKI